MTTLPLPLHYIEVSLSFTSIHLHQSSFNVIHLHPFSFIHLSTFIHLHSLLSTLIHFHPLPSSILIVWFQKISIPPPPQPPWKIIGNSEGEGGSWETSFLTSERVFRGGGMDIFWNHTFTVILQNFASFVVPSYLHTFHVYHLQN